MENIMANIVSAMAFVVVFSGVVVEAIKKMDLVNKQYLPGVSILIGTLCGVSLAFLFNLDMATYAAAGFLSGAGSSGLYDLGELFGKFMGGNK